MQWTRESKAVAVWSSLNTTFLQRALTASGYRAITVAPDAGVPSRACIVIVEPNPMAALQQVALLRGEKRAGPILTVCAGASSHDIETLWTAGANRVLTSATDAEVLAQLALVSDLPTWNRINPLRLPARFDQNARSIEIGVIEALLRPKDFALLQCLAERPGCWHRASELISRVLGTNHADDSSVVRVHVRRIRSELDLAHWCLQSERTRGYLFTTNADLLGGLCYRSGSWRLIDLTGDDRRLVSSRVLPATAERLVLLDSRPNRSRSGPDPET